MFLFDITLGNSANGPTDGFNQLFEAEGKVESLESLLRSLYMKEDYDFDPNTEGNQANPYVDNTNLEAVKQELSVAREAELNILYTQGDSLDHDPSARLNEIRTSEITAEQQIQELQLKLDELMASIQNVSMEPQEEGTEITPLPNEEVLQLQDQLTRMTSYRNELSSSDKFWDSLVNIHKEYQSNVYKENFFNGQAIDGESQGGYNTLTAFEDMLYQIQSGNTGINFSFNSQSIQSFDNLFREIDDGDSTNDQEQIRQKIVDLKKNVISSIPTIQNETWFKEFLQSNTATLNRIDETTLALQKQTEDLHNAFMAMVTGESSEITLGGVTYKSADEIKAQIINNTVYLQDLTSNKEFLSKISSIAALEGDAQGSLIVDSAYSFDSDVENATKLREETEAKYRTIELEHIIENDFDALKELNATLKQIESTNTGDASQVREQISKLKTDILNNLAEAKDNPELKSLLQSAADEFGVNNDSKQASQAKLDQLHDAFISMVKGDITQVTVAGVVYKSVDQIKEQILNTTTYLQELNNNSDFSQQMKKIIGSTGDDTTELINNTIAGLQSESVTFQKLEQTTLAEYRTLELETLITQDFDKLDALELALKGGDGENLDEVRRDILDVKTALLDNLLEAKENPELKPLLEDASKRFDSLSLESQAQSNNLNALQFAFISMMAGGSAIVNGTAYQDPESLKAELLKTNSYLMDINAEKDFFLQIGNILSSDDKDADAEMLAELRTDISSDFENNQNLADLASLDYRSMELRGLLTTRMIGRIPNYEVAGVDNQSVDDINNALKQVAEEEARLREQFNLQDENSTVNQIFARIMDQMVDSRVTDLQNTQNYLEQSQNQFYEMARNLGYIAPQSFYFEDPNLVAVRLELNKVQDYQNQTNDLQTYWDKIIAESNQATPAEAPATVQIKPMALRSAPPPPSTETKPTESNTTETSTTQNNTPDAFKAITLTNQQNVIGLTQIFDLVSDRDSVESLKTRHEQIKEELEYLVNRLESLDKNSPGYQAERQKLMGSITDLQSALSGLVQQMGKSSLLENIGKSVKEAISQASIYQRIYSNF